MTLPLEKGDKGRNSKREEEQGHRPPIRNIRADSRKHTFSQSVLRQAHSETPAQLFGRRSPSHLLDRIRPLVASGTSGPEA
eukprot:2122423-Pyramimonas_sp.AAC.1